MKGRGRSLLNLVRWIFGRNVSFHFDSKRRIVRLFNLRILLILISILPPLQFSHTLHFFAFFFLGFLSKNRLSSAVVLGLVSSLHFFRLHTQRWYFLPHPS